MNMSVEQTKEYTEVKEKFLHGKELITNQDYQSGIEILQKAFDLVGESGIRQVEYLENDGKPKFTLFDYRDLMSTAYMKLEDYPSAMEHAMKWEREVLTRYGRNSNSMAMCYRRIARIWASIHPADSFLDNLENEGIISYIQHLTIMFNFDKCMLLNQIFPNEYYTDAYYILKANKGKDDEIVKELKSEMIEYYTDSVLICEASKFFIYVPVFAGLISIMVLVVWGFSWKALGMFTLLFIMSVIWRVARAAFLGRMTWLHYKKYL